MAFKSIINLLANGESVDASTTNRPLAQLLDNTNWLKEQLETVTNSTALFLNDVVLNSTTAVGQPVYYDTGNQEFAKAQADETDAQNLVGIVYSKDSSVAGSILMLGYAAVDLTAALDGEPLEAGRYYLSDTTAGVLTSTEPTPSVLALTSDGNGNVFVLPVMNLPGSTGSQGSQGAQGAQGNQGYQGSQGSQGYQGYQGTIGSTGVQGNQGSQGVQGSQGYQGSQGNQGVQGSQGAQGSQGVQGTAGAGGDLLYGNFKFVASEEATSSTSAAHLGTEDSVAIVLDAGADIVVQYLSQCKNDTTSGTNSSQIYIDDSPVGTARTHILPATADEYHEHNMMQKFTVGSGAHTVAVKHWTTTGQQGSWKHRSLLVFSVLP